MNKIKLKIGIGILGILLATGSICAQQGNEAPAGTKATGANLTTRQIEAIKAIRQERATFRNAFRETLTGNQLDILTKPGLTRQERLKSFSASLSADQMRMIRAHRRVMRIQNNTIRSAVAEHKRMGIIRMGMNKNQQNRNYFQRVRMQRNKHTGM
ncbi:MAG TPA: hypothetical protein VJ963_01160 [Bacteroidales bacterium]|nr:hypothetical protein [Bacteroidales bacterium]